MSSMQLTETISEPLHREFTVVVGATDLDAKLTGKLAEMQPKIHLKGFRPGKAPVSFLKKTYGKSLMGEIVNETINESSEQLLKDKERKPATTPGWDFVIPGSEDQLIGAKAGDARTINVRFQDTYGAANLAGKDAEFDVKVKAVKSANAVPIDDELAKKVGMESLAQLKERVGEQLKGEYARVSRTHLKRRILDALDSAHDFDLPPGMVEAELEAI